MVCFTHPTKRDRLKFMALLSLRAVSLVGKDLDRMIDEVIEDEEIRRITSTGGHLPMLACRSVDFSYGQLQVLFDVDFTVDDGEMVALLGANGAGKSTLLRTIAGLLAPTAGRVAVDGRDVTGQAPEALLRAGVALVPERRRIFGDLTVLDNLELGGYALPRGRDFASRLAAGVEAAYDRFPVLRQRSGQLLV